MAEASRLCRMDDENVARVLAVIDEPARVVLEHGDASMDLKTFLRHRSSHTFSSTDSPTRLTSSPSRSATAALRSADRQIDLIFSYKHNKFTMCRRSENFCCAMGSKYSTRTRLKKLKKVVG